VITVKTSPSLNPILGTYSLKRKDEFIVGEYFINIPKLSEILQKEFPIIKSEETLLEEGKKFDQLFEDNLHEIVLQREIKPEPTVEPGIIKQNQDIFEEEINEEYYQDDTSEIENVDFEKRNILLKFLKETMIVENNRIISTFTFKFNKKTGEEIFIRTGPFDRCLLNYDLNSFFEIKLTIFSIGIKISAAPIELKYDNFYLSKVLIRNLNKDDMEFLSKHISTLYIENKGNMLNTVIELYIKIPISSERLLYWEREASKKNNSKDLFYNEIKRSPYFLESLSILSISISLALRSSFHILCYKVDFITKEVNDVAIVFPETNQIFWTHINREITAKKLEKKIITKNLNLINFLFNEIIKYVDINTGMIKSINEMKGKKKEKVRFLLICYNIFKTVYDRSRNWILKTELIYELVRGMETLLVESKESTSFQFRYLISTILSNYFPLYDDEEAKLDQNKTYEILNNMYHLRSAVAHLRYKKIFSEEINNKIKDSEIECIYFKFADLLLYLINVSKSNEHIGNIADTFRKLIFKNVKISKREFENEIEIRE